MDLFIPLLMIIGGAHAIKLREQKIRIALLGSYLGKYQIEKLMENLTNGYLRALGESDAERQAQVWNFLASTETELCEQFELFVTDFSKVDEAEAGVSKLPLALPYANKLFPGAMFDLRKILSIHARGITQAIHNSTGQSPKNKAFTVSAELFLMQHTCHWFCRSKTVASARMLARHKTPYAQLLASVAPDTRNAYTALVGP